MSTSMWEFICFRFIHVAVQEKYSTLHVVDTPDIGKATVDIIHHYHLDHDSKYPAPEDRPLRLPKENTTITILHLTFLKHPYH